jgi:cyanophycinase
VAGVGHPPRRRGPLTVLPVLLLLMVAGWGCGTAGAFLAGTIPPQVGPATGAVMAAGGGALGPEIWEAFVERAGGGEARIVVIPTAGTEEVFPPTGPASPP